MSKTDSASLLPSAKGLETVEESPQMSHWKQDKRDMKIDFEYLDKVFPITANDEDQDSTLCVDSQADFFGPSYEKTSELRSPRFPPKRKATPKLSLHSSTLNSVLRGSKFEDLASTGQSFEKLFSEEWWLDFQNPCKEALRHVCTAFDVHPLTVEDIWNQETSEKIEQYPSYQFVCFRSFNEVFEEGELIFKPFTFFQIIFSRGTLSFCFQENNHSKNVEKRIALQPNDQAIKSDWMFYSFIDEIVDSFQPPISRIENAVSKIEDSVYITRQEDGRNYLAKIEANRKQILTLIRLLSRKDSVLRGFKAHHQATVNSSLNPSVILYINDVQDHVIAMLSILNQLEGLLFRAKSSFITQLQGKYYHRKTKTFKLLCSAAVLNMLLTVGITIAQAFGMNVSTKASLFVDKNPIPFMGIVLGYALLVVVFYRVIMKYVWTW